MALDPDFSTMSVKEGQVVRCVPATGELATGMPDKVGVCVNVRPSLLPHARLMTATGWVSAGDCVCDVIFDEGYALFGVSPVPAELAFHRLALTDAVMPADAIDHFRLKQAEWQAALRQDAAARRAAIETEQERLLTNPRYQLLHRGDDTHSGALAAKNIRLELKTAFPDTRFSVRKTGYGAVQIQWADGPSSVCVESLLDRYEATEPHPDDGVQARQENQAWIHCFGGARYLHLARDCSPALIGDALTAVYERHQVPAEARSISAERYLAGSARCVHLPGVVDDLGLLVHRELRQRDAASSHSPAPSPSL